MVYKAIVFDLDGTAMPNAPGGMPSPRLIKAVMAANDKLWMCAATGRPITNAKPILSALSLKDPCIISAGTQIINPLTDEILWEVLIEPSDVNNVLQICQPYQYEILIKNELMGEGNRASERSIKEPVNVVYIMGCLPADTEVMLAALAQINDITASGVTSWTQEGIDIHITHREATKEHSIAELLKILRVKKEETIGVGDANNDVHLFKAVGKKVAMGNATALLKSKADIICDSVENDGLAKFIEDSIL